MPAIKLARLEERARALRLRLARLQADTIILESESRSAFDLPGSEALKNEWRELTLEFGDLALRLTAANEDVE